MVQLPVLQAAPLSHTKEPAQGALLGVQAWLLSQVLVVNVEPEHDGSAQVAPTAG